MRTLILLLVLLCLVSVATAATRYCEEPLFKGPCDKKLKRYGFDKEKGKCVRFLYGGCGMNHNNFRRLKECNQFCKAEKAYNKKKKT
ncbi:hypothetical protein RB195_001239 [Necator americanus]|uniref:BPTI/Kunitz inhibitor domain-containing protein n=1 Tax=Necator americanus TaxID=51031 RepID=A0ABR1DDB8_NECAM